MVFAIGGAILLVAISILYVLLFLGKPLGFLAWGGKYPDVLPDKLRFQSLVSIPAQLFAAFILLSLANVFSNDTSNLITIFAYIFMVFFFINTIMNLLSSSFYEKTIMTPVAFWIFFSFVYMLFIY